MVKKVSGRSQGGDGGTLHQWEKGESGNPTGRPRKIVLQLKHEGYSRYQISETIEKLAAFSLEELKEFSKNKNATVMEIGITRMIEDFITNKKRSNEILEYLLPKKQPPKPTDDPNTNLNHPNPGERVVAVLDAARARRDQDTSKPD